MGWVDYALLQRVREQLLIEKEQRKAAHKKEYELKKARNYIAKYGQLPNGQTFPKHNPNDENPRSID